MGDRKQGYWSEIFDVIHKTIYQFFDVCGDDEAMSDKDKLLLEVNKAICKNIKALEPKTGHWIEGQTNNPKIHNIICSNCLEGYPSRGHANSQHTREKFKFCPNCGAKMESEVEE